jgi:hypothetical protein
MGVIARNAIVRGPGTTQLGTGPVIYSAGDIESAWELAQGEVPSAFFGSVDRYITDKVARTRLTPAGQLTTAMISSLFPHLNPTIGASIFGAADVPLKIHSRDGRLYTLLASAVTKMPDLILSPRKTALGQVEYTSVLKTSGDPTTADHYYTEASSAWSDATFATADVRRRVYSGSWNSITFLTEDGWTVSFDVTLEPTRLDEGGTVDMVITNVVARAKCRPLSTAAADLLTAMRVQGVAGAAIGASVRQAQDLTIAGTGVSVVLKDVALVEAGQAWGAATLRAGEIGFIANRVESTGTFGAVATIAIT